MIDKVQIRYRLAKTRLRAPLVWLRHRHVRTNDVFIASYPRSGSTWLRFLLFDLLSGTEADFSSVHQGIPGVENQSTALPFLPDSGRLLQTHEFFRNEYHKAIYVVRDVRDVVISEFFFGLRKGVFTNGFDSFFFQFLNGKVNPYGYWGNHVESWLASPAASDGKVLFIKFEEMRLNIGAVLVDILEFLGINRDIEAIRKAVQNNTIDKMREKENRAPKGTFKTNRTGIHFIRQGSSGGWRETLSEKQLEIIEARLGRTLDRLGYSLENSLGRTLRE